ncbi:RNA polymerase sigma-54 factor [Neisseria sp. HSC-16F19]|nr:RNA polymerase factor sigma-54 [Neisseria sp. HSC-16F19]MCP2039452.1 RNA polymerase sigma-54 factor [Neisseria sp. HSC-16F19]
MSKAALSLKLKQTQQLNQNLQQSLRVLHMSSQALEDEVADWLADNPFLEKTELPDGGEPLLPQQYVKPAEHAHVGGDDAADIWATVASDPDLIAQLHAQVCEHPLDETTAAHVHILIDSLDDQGYLADSLADIAENMPLEWMLDEDDLAEALTALQRFDPPGIGARDLRESLLLQLARHELNDVTLCAAKLVRNHLGQWQTASQQKQLQRQLPGVSNDVFQAALQLIGSLNPFPAYGLTSAQPTAYVQPDVAIYETSKGWQIETVKTSWPQLQLNSEYTELLADVELTPEFKSKMQEAQAHLDSLKLRQSTVLRLTEWILAKQADFFTFGPIGLAPLTLKETAQALGLAESTISRAVNQKYLACPRGVFALRYFFSQAVSQNENNEGGSSQTAVKTLLETLISQEDPKKPYSDNALTEQLAKQGINLARRTVAKYREELRIPPAHQRKQR